MAAPDPKVNGAIEAWLNEWAQWLELWLQSGTDAPGPGAKAAIERWRKTIPADGYGEVRRLIENLLDTTSSRAQKADALLSLIVWQRAAQRILQTKDLAG